MCRIACRQCAAASAPDLTEIHLKMCPAPGCDRAKFGLKAYCRKHDEAMRRNGTLERLPLGPKPKEKPPCIVDGCTKKSRKRGVCPGHYTAWWRGDLELPGQPSPELPPCKVTGCIHRADGSKGFCNGHYIRWKNTGDPGSPELQEKTPRADTCAGPGEEEGVPCPKRVLARDYCSGHYKQVSDGRPLAPLVPRAANGEGWVTSEGYKCFKKDGETWMAHRWAANEELLRSVGRPLRPHTEEEVHHCNGDKITGNWTDGPFRINHRGQLVSGNLEIWSKSQPAGQEIGPKLDWAFSMLEEYLPMLDEGRVEHLQDLASRSAGLYGRVTAGERPAEPQETRVTEHPIKAVVRTAPEALHTVNESTPIEHLLAIAEALAEQEWPSQGHRKLAGHVMHATAMLSEEAHDECYGDLSTGMIRGNYDDVLLVGTMPEIAKHLRALA